MIGVQQYGRSVASPARTFSGGRPSLREAAGEDPVASWTEARASLEAAGGADGALDTVMKTPFGEMPADTFLGIIVLDALTHTWDLARATGLDDNLDPELVSIAFERIRPSTPPSAGPTSARRSRRRRAPTSRPA